MSSRRLHRHPAAEAGRFGLFAWQSGWVFALRSAQLWSDPTTAGAVLTDMALEKGRAFADGMVAASAAVLNGGTPAAVATAALAPARRRVSANLRALHRTG